MIRFRIQPHTKAKVPLDAEGEWPAGSRIALLGASGAGKTSLLRMLAGFDCHPGADVHIQDQHNPSPTYSAACLVHQQPVMFAHLSVAESIGLIQQRAQPEKALPLLAWAKALGLMPVWGQPSGQLSGGQAQRVALLRALASGKSWLLLDEPISALDADLLWRTVDVIDDYCRLTGAGLVLSSHQDSVQRALCNNAYRMHGLVGETTGPLFSALAKDNPLVATLTTVVKDAEHGVLALAFEGQTLYCQCPETWREGQARVSISAEDISLTTSANHHSTMLNRVKVRIESMETVNEQQIKVNLQAGQQLLVAVVSPWSVERLALAEGMGLFAEWKVGASRWHGQWFE